MESNQTKLKNAFIARSIQRFGEGVFGYERIVH